MASSSSNLSSNLLKISLVGLLALVVVFIHLDTSSELRELQRQHDSSSSSSSSSDDHKNKLPLLFQANTLKAEQERLPKSTVVQRIDFWADSKQEQEHAHDDGDDRVALLQVVSHRELLIGCHSFTQYLSPRFHTLLVFPRNVALQLQLDKLVQQATEEQTAGVHLFLTDSWAGPSHARKLGDWFARYELEPRGIHVRYLSSANCDVHQLPVEHKLFRPFQDMAIQLAKDLELANQFSAKGQLQTLVTNYNADGYPVDPAGYCTNDCHSDTPHAKRPVLAMNTPLFEDIPNMETLSNHHGHDNMNWWQLGGWNRRDAVFSEKGLDASLPWLQDESHFFEDHFIMFDLQAFRQFSELYFTVAPDCFPDENNFLGPVANSYGFTLLRNNDVVPRIDFAHKPVYFEPFVDMEQILVWNYQLLGTYRHPRFLSGNWERAKSIMKVTTTHRPFTPFAYLHCRKKFWFPNSWTESSKTSDPHVLPVLDAYMSYHGYLRVHEYAQNTTAKLRYVLDGVFPATMLVYYGRDHNKTQAMFSFQQQQVNNDIYVDKHYLGLPSALEQLNVVEIPAHATLPRSMFHACDD